MSRPDLEDAQGADRALPWLTWRQLALLVLGFLGLILIWTRFRHLGESFWNDEASTALRFVGQGPDVILARDSILSENNHVLFSLLAWATGAATSPTEAAYRAWSVVPGAIAVVAATWWAWRRLGIATALILATLFVASPLHADQTSYARGYGLVILAAVAIIVAADALARRPSNGRLVGVLAAAAVGVATLYSFALVVIGHVLALLAQPRLRRPLLIGGALAVVAGFTLFGPAIEDLSEARPIGVESLSLFDALTLSAAFEAIGYAGAPDWIAVPGFVLAASGAFALYRRGERELMLNLVLPPLVVNLVFSLADAPDEARYQLIVMPHVLLLVSIGLAAVAVAIWSVRGLRYPAAIAGIGVVLLLSLRMVEREEYGKVVPLQDPRGAAQVIVRAGINKVLTDSIRPAGLRYYVGEAGGTLKVGLPDEIEQRLCDEPAPFAYVHHEPLPLEDVPSFAHPAATDCLERRGAIPIEIPQRQRYEPLVVWLVPADAAEHSPGASG